MDRSSLCSKLKHSNFSKVGRNPSWDIPFGKDNCYHNMINNVGDYNHNLVAAGGLFSWPPTCYTCSFCKREFRSAQALGGHMNVHRRDKARLMKPQSPPKNDGDDDVDVGVDHNPNLEFTNPNSASENPNFSLSFAEFPHLASALPRFFARTQTKNNDGARPVITRDFMKIKDPNGLSGVGEFDLFVSEEIVKKRDFAQLDLEIGLITSHQSKEELDLELRL